MSVFPPDSAISYGMAGAAMLGGTDSDTMVMLARGGFSVTLDTRECAAPNVTVSVVSPTDSLLGSTMCQQSFPHTWQFPGPYPAGSGIVLNVTPNYYTAPGAFQISGTDPTWTVRVEAGFDTDFNDLELTVRALPSELECPAVERGQTVTCEIVIPVDSVLEWNFVGVPPLTDDTVKASSNDSSSTWQGVAVLDGTVTAIVSAGSTIDTLVALMDVLDRPWHWGPADWTFTEGGGHLCGYTPFHFPDTVRLAGR